MQYLKEVLVYVLTIYLVVLIGRMIFSWVQVFARLKPGFTVASAQPPMQGLFRQIRSVVCPQTLPQSRPDPQQ